MSNNSKTTKLPKLENPVVNKGPLSLRLKDNTRVKLEAIAAANHLSLCDITNLCIAAGIPMVESKFNEMHGRKEEVAA